jgi:hydroxymethylbilane synthase
MSAVRPVRLGTRGSQLARAQTGQVADRLRAAGCDVEVVVVRTEGDRNSAPLVELAGALGGTGIFVSALREQLADGGIDIAVHSLKDLPVAAAPGLLLAAVPERADPADVLVSAHAGGFDGLPAGATVGTGAPRRAAQIRAERPDLTVVAVRGNIDTRLAMVGDAVDAIVLAGAGLARTGRLGTLTGVTALDFMLPAPGQGALALETRADAAAARPAWWSAVQGLDARDTRACVCAERAVLGTLGAGCTAPVGALATVRTSEGPATLHVDAAVLAPDGSAAVRASIDGAVEEAERLGTQLGERLLTGGAGRLWQAGPEPTRRSEPVSDRPQY